MSELHCENCGKGTAEKWYISMDTNKLFCRACIVPKMGTYYSESVPVKVPNIEEVYSIDIIEVSDE